MEDEDAKLSFLKNINFSLNIENSKMDFKNFVYTVNGR